MCAKIQRKRTRAPKVRTAFEDKSLIIENKRKRRKTDPELTAEINYS